jgi:hypothetical protein
MRVLGVGRIQQLHVVRVVAAFQRVTRTVGGDGRERRGAGCRSSSRGLSLFGHGSKAPLPERVLVTGEVERTVELEAESYARTTCALEQIITYFLLAALDARHKEPGRPADKVRSSQHTYNNNSSSRSSSNNNSNKNNNPNHHTKLETVADVFHK